MTEQEFEEIKDLWKLCYAEKAIEEAMYSIKYIFDNQLQRDDPLFNALLVGIYSLYGRPFSKNAFVGALKIDFPSRADRIYHGNMIKFRNELFTHSDTRANRTAQHGPLLQVGCTFTRGQDSSLFTTCIQLRPEHFQDLMRFLIKVGRMIEGRKMLRWIQFDSQRPQDDGEYILNIYDQTKTVWITRAEAMRLCPPDSTLIDAISPPEE